MGQTSSALCSSASQNLTAVGSSHSLAETVLHLAMTLFGLVSSEHGGTSLIFGIGSVSDSDPMDAFYSDNIYYIHKPLGLSRVFFVLGHFFAFLARFSAESPALWSISTKNITNIRTFFAWPPPSRPSSRQPRPRPRRWRTRCRPAPRSPTAEGSHPPERPWCGRRR